MIKEIRYETPTNFLPKLEGKTIFLAGPTVRGHQPHLTSWRFECIEMFRRLGFEGNIIIPEFESKTESDKGKEWVPLWEFTGLRRADVILFWIPRTKDLIDWEAKTLTTGLIALTTNWEHGYWVGRQQEKCVYGRPDDAYRMGYLDIMWKAAAEDAGKAVPPIHRTMEETVLGVMETLFVSVPMVKHIQND